MPETLILHLGLHKTATTALQEFLAGETKALLDHGVFYPRLARMRSDLTPLIASAAKPDRAALGRFVTGMPAKFEAASGGARLNAIIITCDAASGRASAIERINLSALDVEALAKHG